MEICSEQIFTTTVLIITIQYLEKIIPEQIFTLLLIIFTLI